MARNGGVPERNWREREAHRRQVARAARALPREPAGDLPRIALAFATLAWLGVLGWLSLTLPEQVPTHWSIGNVPDGWSTRTGALLFSLLLPLATTFPLLWLSRLPFVWPDGINLPEATKRWWLETPERLVRFERLLREDLMLIVAAMLLTFVAGDIVIGVAAHHADGAAPSGSLPVVLGGSLVAFGIIIVRMLGGRYRPRASGRDELAH